MKIYIMIIDAENSGNNKECGVYAVSSLIFLFSKWWSLDFLCNTCGRLVSWSKSLSLIFTYNIAYKKLYFNCFILKF